MLFSSYTFIFLFLPITFFVYFYFLQRKLILVAKGYLIVASLFFYSWWNIIYLPLIIFSLLFNFFIANHLNKFKQQKKLLFFGIFMNLVLLGYFKYTDFFIENYNMLFNSSSTLLYLALPLAISFFTFQQIAFLVDSYHQNTNKYNFFDYTLFVTFFPQLIAGPIVHHSEMMPQFYSKWNLVKNYKNIILGVFIFTIGLFKKIVIADNFAYWVRHGFDKSETLNIIEAWSTSLSYTFQLYFDFSGYTDMAIGIALLFNIKLPINFNSPYKAFDIQDFWKRWHITLSRFLKEYIYIPLGGNRKGTLRTYHNLLATFILGGLWHGAGWTFVFWGFLHGIALVIHRVWKSMGLTMPKILAWFITFNFINISWIFFRAKEWDDAIKILLSMFDFNSLYTFNTLSLNNILLNIQGDIQTILWLVLSFIIILKFKNSNQLIDYSILQKTKVLTPIYTIGFAFMFVFSLIYMSFSSYSEFIYFNF